MVTPACQTAWGSAPAQYLSVGAVATPMSRPNPNNKVMARPSDRWTARCMAIRQPKAARNPGQPHPKDRSRPREAPTANRPVVTATSPTVWPSRVPAASRVSGVPSGTAFELIWTVNRAYRQAFAEVPNLPARLTYQAGALPFGCKQRFKQSQRTPDA
jgi:hypothetical protein